MKTFFAIAFRNVFRNTRRSILTVSVITFGAVALILSGGFFAYNFEGLRETTIRNGIGHLQIYTEAFLDDGEERPLDNGIEASAALQSWLEEQDNVVASTAQIDFVGLVSNGEKSEAFIGSGVDPNGEMEMGFSMTVRDGEPLYDEDVDQVLLGTELAKSMHVGVGDLVTLLGTTTDGALNAIDAEVVGLFSTGIKQYDARAIKVSLASAQRLLDSDRVTKLIVRLDATKSTESVRDRWLASGIQGSVEPLRIKTWEELATFYGQVVTLYNAIFFFVGAIIIILVVLSSSNTMMMAVFERVKEIGTLMAIGTKRRQVLTIFVLEGFIIGILGSLVGLATSYGLIKLINGAGLMMPPPPTYSSELPLLINVVPPLFAAVSVLMITTLTLAALIPAVRGARMEIVEALGHV